jgi:hypothetical protein
LKRHRVKPAHERRKPYQPLRRHSQRQVAARTP